MPKVATVRGEVDTDTLGQTLMHEHIVNITAGDREGVPGSQLESVARTAWSARSSRRCAR